MLDRKQLGERLRIARQRMNMSQLELSLALEDHDIKLNQTAIGKIERGERNMYVHQLVAFADVLDVSVGWVLKGGDISIP